MHVLLADDLYEDCLMIKEVSQTFLRKGWTDAMNYKNV